MTKKNTPSWLDNAILYQIYPQSFQDSNGDGIGDLKGIQERLGYIKSLGVDAIWLNPIFDSPFEDAGYDVRNFYEIAERYGNTEDLAELIQEAHSLGLKVLLDIVAGHTSVEHPWFQSSSLHGENEYTDRYIWTDSVWNADPTKNGRFLSGYGNRDGAFMINFFWCQPALNYGFANPEADWQQPVDAPGPLKMRKELKNIMSHWLKMGCDGFRVDMAHSLIKGKGPIRQKALVNLWQEVRVWMEKEFPETILLAEWGAPQDAIECGFHIDFMLHTHSPAWNSLFRTREAVGVGRDPYGPTYFEKSGLGNINRYYDYYLKHLRATESKGFISVPSGNHDTPPRLGKDRDFSDLKVAFAFLLTQPGVPTIYYGDEIGMQGVDGLPSKEGAFNRTCLRTPMQWNSQDPNAGFSISDPKDLYLPIGDDLPKVNVQDQNTDPYSLLNFVRELIALRKTKSALGNQGSIELLYAPQGGVPLIYKRTSGIDEIIVALNPANRKATAPFPEKISEDQLIAGVLPKWEEGQLVLSEVSFSIFLCPK